MILTVVAWASLRFEKDWKKIDSFQEFFEKFRL